MSDVLTHPAEQLTEDEERQVQDMLREMKELNAQMRRDQERMDRHKANWVGLTAESARLKSEIRESLARLGERL
jgi:peptidoglycan hydrolase CwlO-like protein